MIHLEKADVSLTREGHILINVHENQELELNDVQAIDRAKRQLCGDKRHTVIFVTPTFGTITARARDFAASAACNQNAIAKAIVATSIGTRLISNFFIGFHKPAAPTRVFNSVESAVEWLEKVKAGQGAIV